MAKELAIVATGYHVPSLAVRAGDEGFEALSEGAREIGVANYDEDETSMAVEAARWALRSAGVEGTDVTKVVVAASEGFDTEILSIALGLEEPEVELLEAGESLLGEAFSRAADSGRTLAIASHVPPYDEGDPVERALGAGAAAFLLAHEAGVTLASSSSESENQPAELPDLLGDLGPAAAPMNLVHALSRCVEGQTFSLPAGGGDSGAPTFTVDQPPKGPEGMARDIASRRRYLSREAYEALRDQRATPTDTTSMGAYVSPAAYGEHPEARYRLVGRKCVECGTLGFSPRQACVPCGSTEFEPVPLEPTGSLYAVTTIGAGGAPSEFAPLQAATGPYGVAVVQLDDGPRLTAMLTDGDPGAMEIGSPVRATFRRIYNQDGVTRYGLKVRPRTGTE